MRLTVVAVRGSCGQAEIWSAGSKHQYTALKAAPSDQTVGRGPARQGSRRQRMATGQSSRHDSTWRTRFRRIMAPPAPPRGSGPQPAPAGQPRRFRADGVPKATDRLRVNAAARPEVVVGDVIVTSYVVGIAGILDSGPYCPCHRSHLARLPGHPPAGMQGRNARLSRAERAWRDLETAPPGGFCGFRCARTGRLVRACPGSAGSFLRF